MGLCFYLRGSSSTTLLTAWLFAIEHPLRRRGLLFGRASGGGTMAAAMAVTERQSCSVAFSCTSPAEPAHLFLCGCSFRHSSNSLGLFNRARTGAPSFGHESSSMTNV